MSVLRLSSRYAKALLVLAEEQNKLELIYNDILTLAKSIESVKELELVFKSPIIKSDKKQSIYTAIFADKLDKLTNSFVEILIRKGRERYLLGVTKSFIMQYNTFNKITPVNIKSAVELSDKVVEELLDKLKSITTLENTTVVKEVDPKIIGGFVLRYEDKLYDTSVSSQLNKIRLLIDNKEFIKHV